MTQIVLRAGARVVGQVASLFGTPLRVGSPRGPSAELFDVLGELALEARPPLRIE
jgi:hypothetical protein